MFDVNTWDLLHEFEAHSDFIRSIAVHPSLPCLLTSGGESTRVVHTFLTVSDSRLEILKWQLKLLLLSLIGPHKF